MFVVPALPSRFRMVAQRNSPHGSEQWRSWRARESRTFGFPTVFLVFCWVRCFVCFFFWVKRFVTPPRAEPKLFWCKYNNHDTYSFDCLCWRDAPLRAQRKSPKNNKNKNPGRPTGLCIVQEVLPTRTKIVPDGGCWRLGALCSGFSCVRAAEPEILKKENTSVLGARGLARGCAYEICECWRCGLCCIRHAKTIFGVGRRERVNHKRTSSPPPEKSLH